MSYVNPMFLRSDLLSVISDCIGNLTYFSDVQIG